MRQVKRSLKAAKVPKGELIAELGDGDSFVIKVDGQERDMMNMKDYISLVQVSGLPNAGNVYIEKVGEEDALEYRLLVDSSHPKVWQSISNYLRTLCRLTRYGVTTRRQLSNSLGLGGPRLYGRPTQLHQMNSMRIRTYDYRYDSYHC